MAVIDKHDTQLKCIAAVAGVLHKEEAVIVSTRSFEELGADSLDKIEIIMRLEEQFNVQIDDDLVDTHQQLHQTIDYVHTLRG